MYKIKEKLEDFIVKEKTNIKGKQERDRYVYFFLKKQNLTTIEAIERIANKLKIKIKRIGFAGNKDKKAITEQLISFFKVSKERIENLKLKNISLKFYGYGNKPILLGDLEGNYFIIVVRNLTKKDIDRFNKNKNKKALNLFGEQRFSKQNIKIGKALIKKDFKKAIELIIKNEGCYERDVKEYLKENKNDFVGALRKINKNILKLYIHAYQSYIFNKTLKEYSKNTNKQEKIPIVGFGTDLNVFNKKIREIIEKIMKEEGISFRDFIIKQIPELSSFGGERDLFIEIKNFSYKIMDDDLNIGKKKMILKFFLKKGCYATTVIKFLFSN